MDFGQTCFVIMPFGKKEVNGKEVDFDAIYRDIFVPAVESVELPESKGLFLVPKRTDDDFFSSQISTEMFNYLERSRIALADLTSLNANVFYELGHRHRARQSGTVLLRQEVAPLPFDISQIRTFTYEVLGEGPQQARELIQRVLTESLKKKQKDSPIRAALGDGVGDPRDVEHLMKEAAEALRERDHATAIDRYRKACRAVPDWALLRVRLGVIYRDQGMLTEALDQIDRAIEIDGELSEAWREKGIIQNKLFHRECIGNNGMKYLEKAIELDPEDFDAMASLGGIHKRRKDFEASLGYYEKSLRLAPTNSYPLLNVIKLRAVLEEKVEVDSATRFLLERAQRYRSAQASQPNPYDAPWSFFDAAEIRFFLGDEEGFIEDIKKSRSQCDASWQLETFRKSLGLLESRSIGGLALSRAVELLEESEYDLMKAEGEEQLPGRRRRALIVGIDQYGDAVEDLSSRVEDAEKIEDLFTYHGDGEPEDDFRGDLNFRATSLLGRLGEPPTRQEDLRDELINLFESEVEVALFYFTGHGFGEGGGGLVLGDSQAPDEGFSFYELMELANKSQAENVVIILDCCFSGVAGDRPVDAAAQLFPGVTILTACGQGEVAIESSKNRTTFSRLLIEALEGGAANLLGEVTTTGAYSLLDRTLGVFAQGPMLKANIDEVISLRRVHPLLSKEDLRELPDVFSGGDSMSLDPSYDTEDGEIDPEKERLVELLRRYRDIGLVKTVGSRNFSDAARFSRECSLTTLGKLYRKLKLN